MKRAIFSAILISAAIVPALITAQPQKPAVTAKQKPAHLNEDDGQKIFEQNCSRCHQAPEGFSPRISGTIVHHMRVRANLSREDEQKLLRFFNP